MNITKSVTIDGRDPNDVSRNITINAGNGTDQTANTGDGFRIFTIEIGFTASPVEINSLTLRGGDPHESGGAIYCLAADLLIKNTVITGNASEDSGSGIFAKSGNLTIENSEISDNHTGELGRGRGIFFDRGAQLNVISSTISDNDGGGVFAYGSETSVSVQSSVISGNQAGIFSGGGIYFLGYKLNVQSSTIRDNASAAAVPFGSPVGGGGIFAQVSTNRQDGSITIDQSKIDNNQTTGYNSFGAGALLFSNNSLVTITGTTISNNKALGEDVNIGGIAVLADNNSNVVVDRTKVIGNHADDDVGGIYIETLHDSVVRLANSEISGNDANHNANFDAAAGMWIYARFGGQATIENSTISDNKIVTPDGAGNQDVDGGGVFIQSDVGTTITLLNSTISGNKAEGSGGGIEIAGGSYQGGSVKIRHCTITNNRANSDNDTVGAGGGIHIGDSTTTVTLDHTIVAGNFRGTGSTRDDISGAIAASWSLIGDNTWATITNNGGNQIGTSMSPIDPYLVPLALNGGPTMTHALQAFSPARNMGDPTAVPGVNDVPQYDQRGAGFSRKVESRIDIGAFESNGSCVYVSTTADDFDSNLSYGDLSLREAINYANSATEPTTIFLPAGTYPLYLSGTGGISQGDLDVTGNVTILGDGPGLSIIDGSSSSSGRILDVANSGILNLSRVTLAMGYGTHNSDQRDGGAIRVGGQLHMDYCAIVGSETGGWGVGGGIYFCPTASGSIEASVITLNYGDQQTGGLYLEDAAGTGGTVTLKSTIIANNWDGEGTEYPDIYVGANRTLDSLGYNRFTSASGFTTAATDSMGSVDYVVTSVADTFSYDSNPTNLSLRDAIYLANTTAGTQEIWLPAWDFVLTRERTTAHNLPEMNVWEGDIEITDSLILRGINGPNNVAATKVGWAPGTLSDKVFELVGDYDGSGIVDTGDYDVYSSQLGQSGPDLAADGDDDGNVDSGDHAIWWAQYGITLDREAIIIG